MWNLRIARKRDLKLEEFRHARDRQVLRRKERREIYAEWLTNFGHLHDVVTSGSVAEVTKAVAALSRVAHTIELIGSNEVAIAVNAELISLRQLEVRVTDREKIMLAAIESEEIVLGLMRADME